MNIREAIKRLAENNDELYLKIGIVTDIDPDRRTCDVTPLDGTAPLPDVKLQAGETGSNALIAWPRRGSHVVVGFLNADAGCVLLTHDPERIQATVGENTIDIDEQRIQAATGEKISLTIKDDGITLNGGEIKETTPPDKPDQQTKQAKQTTLVIQNDGITLNGGSLGGVVNIGALQTYLTQLNTAITAGLKGVGIDNGAGAGVFETAIKALNFNNMEDKNVKH